VAKNKEGKILKRTGQLHEALDGMRLENLYPDTQGELNAVMLPQYRAQKSALSPDTPNLSPNEIDCLKAILGF